MKRQVSIEDISDGHFYRRNDMARIGCGGCAGCSACCRGMGESVVLDPMDVYRILEGTGMSVGELFADKAELNVEEGIILPNLRMAGAAESCGFLNDKGRCSIYPYRPGICRMFPLGRYYENNTFQYFIQKNECPAKNRTKVRIEKWLELPDIAKYEEYIIKWHYFLQNAQKKAVKETDETFLRNMNMYILELFYMKPYTADGGFYPEFEDRLEQAEEVLSL